MVWAAGGLIRAAGIPGGVVKNVGQRSVSEYKQRLVKHSLASRVSLLFPVAGIHAVPMYLNDWLPCSIPISAVLSPNEKGITTTPLDTFSLHHDLVGATVSLPPNVPLWCIDHFK